MCRGGGCRTCGGDGRLGGAVMKAARRVDGRGRDLAPSAVRGAVMKAPQRGLADGRGGSTGGAAMRP